MKILLISDTVFDQNGVSRFIQDMATEAQETAHEFYVLTSSPLTSKTHLDNIINLTPYYSRKMPFYQELFLSFASIKSFMAKIQELKPDILHISTPGPIGLLGLYASRKLKIPFASTYHTDFPSYIEKNMNSKFLGKIATHYMRFFYQKAVFVVTRSSASQKVLEQNIKIDKEKIYALRAGTDTQKFHPSYKQEAIWDTFGVDKNSIKMLYVGRLSVEKNFHWLLDFFKKHQEYFREKNVVLVVVGYGKILNKMSEAEKSNIHLLGIQHVPKLSAIYASSDFFITPSVTETLGQVVLEAMASGLPCIVTNEGGPAKFVNSVSENGFVLEALQDALWLDAIHKLVESKELRKTLGNNSFEYMQNFSISHTFKSFWNIHKEFLQNNQIVK